MQTTILTSAATGDLTTLKEIASESSQIIPLVMNKVCTMSFRLFILRPSVSNFYLISIMLNYCISLWLVGIDAPKLLSLLALHYLSSPDDI